MNGPTNYGDAIEAAKAKADGAGWTFKSEDSGWTTISLGPGSGTGYTPDLKQEHKIYYEEGTVTVTRLQKKDASSGTTDYEYYDDAPDSVNTNTASIASKDLKVSNDSSKVLYFINYARLFLNARNDSQGMSAGAAATQGVVGSAIAGNKDNYWGENAAIATAYLIIYIALVVLTAVFTFRYIKRVIYIAFLTLIAPMVALTYPLDKIKDRKGTSMEYVV